MISLHFAFQTITVVLPSEVPKLPPVLTCEGVSQCMETFPPSLLPPQGTGSHPESLCLFSPFFFPFLEKCIYFYLKDNCFKIFCWFLPFINMNQS